MKSKLREYAYLRKEYPEIITKEQFYKIAHISKATALYLLTSGKVPCVDSGKKTRKYKIRLDDVIAYLVDRDLHPEKYEAVQSANWHGRSVEVENVGGISLFSTCGISGCYCSSCSWYKKTKKYDEYTHITYEQCDSCSANEFAYGVRDDHTFRNGYCTVCGYEEPAASCTHGRYYTQWSGCDWYEYCYYCDELMDYETIPNFV